MARNPELEAILQARYNLETSEPGEKTACRKRLDALIEAALSGTKARSGHVSSRAFMEIIAEPYQEFKLAKKKDERARLSRLH